MRTKRNNSNSQFLTKLLVGVKKKLKVLEIGFSCDEWFLLYM